MDGETEIIDKDGEHGNVCIKDSVVGGGFIKGRSDDSSVVDVVALRSV